MFIHEIFDNSTLWVVGSFLLITLAVGLYAGRGIKTIKEYALGDGRFSTTTLVLTFLATDIGGGSVIGGIEDTYSSGVIWCLECLGFGVQLIIFAIIISPKLINFKGSLTIGDIVGRMYGKKAKIITGITTLFFSVCIISLQISVLGQLCESLLGINKRIAIITCTIILGIYSSFGGIRSVTFTDVFQFIVLIIVIPMLAGIMLKKVGGYKNLLLSVPKENLAVFKHKDFWEYFSYFLIWCIFPTLLTDPPLVQRALMTSNKTQLKNKYFTIAAIDSVFRIVILIIGLSTVVLYPKIKTSNIVTHIINNVLVSGFIKGLVISGLLAVVMSSADSYMHSAGLTFSNDIYLPIFKKKKRINELFIARISTVIISIASIFLVINDNFTKKFILWSLEITTPLILPAILLGILGLKPEKKAFFIGVFSGIVSLLFFNFYLPDSLKTLSVPISTTLNGLFFVFSSIILNKGIILVKRENDSNNTTEELWKPSLEKTLNWFLSCIPTPRKIFDFSRESVVKHGTFNIIFGIYCCVNFTLPYFMWDHEVKETYDFMIYLRLIGGIMAALCIVKDQWKEFLKPYFSLFWHATLLFCLPFVTTLMFFLTQGSFTWLFNIATAIFFLILLVDGPMFCILGTLGIALGIGYYKWQFGPLNMGALGFDTNYYLIYQILFPTIISLLFAYRKKFFYLIRGNQGVNLGLSLCHELRNTGLQALPSSQYLNRKVLQIKEHTIIKSKNEYLLDEKMMKFLINTSSEIEKHTKETIKVVSTFEKLLLEFRNSLSNPQICSMKSVIEYALDEYSFLPGQKKKVSTRLYEDFYAKIPKEAFAFVLSNIIRNSYKHGKATEIKIWLKNHSLHVWDNGKGVPASDTTEIFKLFYTTGDQTSSGVGLAFAKQIVQSFYGEIWCESEEGKNSYTEFVIKFPEVYAGEISDKSLNEAKKDGLNEGMRKEKQMVANKMIRAGERAESIEEMTELSVSEIQELIREHKSNKSK